MKPMNQRNRSSERGSTILEFAIIAPGLVLLFFGSIGLGIMMGRYIQTVQTCRDVAHMYVDGVDFTQSANQNIVIQQLASGTGITATGGNGVVILSRITTVYQADCDAAGFSGSCNNLNNAVITQRISFGNAALRSSYFGTPTSTLMDSSGNIAPSVYLQNTDSSVQATGFTALLTAAGTVQAQGDAAWVAEVFFTYPDISFLGTSTAGGAYSRFIF
jgi:Flp pilus assembly protein TadG